MLRQNCEFVSLCAGRPAGRSAAACFHQQRSAWERRPGSDWRRHSDKHNHHFDIKVRIVFSCDSQSVINSAWICWLTENNRQLHIRFWFCTTGSVEASDALLTQQLSRHAARSTNSSFIVTLRDSIQTPAGSVCSSRINHPCLRF